MKQQEKRIYKYEESLVNDSKTKEKGHPTWLRDAISLWPRIAEASGVLEASPLQRHLRAQEHKASHRHEDDVRRYASINYFPSISPLFPHLISIYFKEYQTEIP